MKCYHEYVFKEISDIIVNNLELLYNYNDDALNNIKNYCIARDHEKYKPLDYTTLIRFTEEALAEIVNLSFLIDFRDIE